MIDKPPELGSRKPEDWIRHFLGYFQKVRFEFLRVHNVWFPAMTNGLGAEVHGTHPAHLVTATNSAYVSMLAPRDLSEVKEVMLRLIPTTTGTIDYTVNITHAGVSEDEALNTGTLSATSISVTDDVITEIDVTSLFSTIDRDDQIGIQFVLDAVSTTTNVNVLGINFKYR